MVHSHVADGQIDLLLSEFLPLQQYLLQLLLWNEVVLPTESCELFLEEGSVPSDEVGYLIEGLFFLFFGQQFEGIDDLSQTVDELGCWDLGIAFQLIFLVAVQQELYCVFLAEEEGFVGQHRDEVFAGKLFDGGVEDVRFEFVEGVAIVFHSVG